MRWALLLLLVSCGGVVEPGSGDDGGGADLALAPAELAASVDLTPSDLAARPDLAPSGDLRSAADLRPSGPPDLLECKTGCLGVECGPIPDGCGKIVDCGDCNGAPGEYCVKWTSPRFQIAVGNAVSHVKQTHPEYFDLNDTVGGGSVKVLDPTRFRADVVARLVSLGLTAIPDPNDSREIRVKDVPSNSAENYLLITSAGYTVSRYTSTCTPAGF